MTPETGYINVIYIFIFFSPQKTQESIKKTLCFMLEQFKYCFAGVLALKWL